MYMIAETGLLHPKRLRKRGLTNHRKHVKLIKHPKTERLWVGPSDHEPDAPMTIPMPKRAGGRMLDPGSDKPMTTIGFLIGVELVKNGRTSPQQIKNRLIDGLTYMEDIGKTDVELLGELDLYPGAEDSPTNNNATSKEHQDG